LFFCRSQSLLQRVFSSASSATAPTNNTTSSNTQTQSQTQTQSNTTHNNPKKNVMRIPMFGEGLELGAKSLLYKLMWGDSRFKMNALHPGNFSWISVLFVFLFFLSFLT
jgi:hypothetical protein